MVELDQIKYGLPAAKANLTEVGESLDLAGLESRLEEIEIKTQIDGFWEDHEAAQKLLKEKKSLENTVTGYRDLERALEDIEVLIEMAEESEADSSAEENAHMAEEIKEAYESYKAKVEEVRLKTLLTGEYDSNSAIFTVHAGTGGVDAMDWAEMLLRMYTRWAEKKGYKTKVIDLQDDTEAGIKSATVIVEGENAYGYLKNERGVHRLVRISPFNAQGKRQTSFASLEVMPELDDDINIEIDPEDLRIDTYRSSGAGGQHVNKTDSAIRITHLPTNIVVTCQNERSQHQNKDMAMKVLKAKLTELAEQEHKDNLKELKGDFSQNTWGSQIRSYVFQPYTMVKDHRTGAEVGNVQAVMDGEIDYFINEKLKFKD
nr:peptide chain release factor 2 [uncultured Aminipila sp.]